MSLSISSASAALSLLQSANSSTGSTDLASILYGGTTSSTVDPISALLNAEKNQTHDIAVQAKQPQTQAEIKRFLAVVGKAKTLQDVMNDPIARKVLLTANGLGDQVDYTALATKALLSSPTDTNSLANQLSNQAYKSMVATFDFKDKGLSVLKQPNVLTTITNGYAQVVWEQSLDQQTPGLSAALDFRARASTITNVDQILGDANFRKVVTGAFGIPEQIAFQPLEAQEKAVSTRINVSKLKDPKYVEQIARQFLIMNSVNNSSTTGASTTSLFA